MKTHPAKKLGSACGAAIILCIVVFTTGGALAATAPIYKCVDKDLRVLYTDERCNNGKQLDVRAGDADPAAVARLDRARDALDQSAAQRIALLQRGATLAERTPQAGNAAVDESQLYEGEPVYAPAYGFVSRPARHRHPIRHRHPESQHMRQFAPPPPQHVARR